MTNHLPRAMWQRVDQVGIDHASLVEIGDGRELAGCASYPDDGGQTTLGYRIRVDRRWHTVWAEVQGTVAGERVERYIESRRRRWFVDDVERPRVRDCIDLDLSFSPATNLLSIRRLNLKVGHFARVRSALLSLPSLDLEPLDQIYRRESDRTYRYESDGGNFVRTLTVDDYGFVIDYPGLWRDDSPDAP